VPVRDPGKNTSTQPVLTHAQSVPQGEGPFTLFAPNDEAFAKTPSDQLDALLADKEKLTSVLMPK
jgi:uncharacterized surface protein with fasciclin (FAS1) repeats